VTDVTARNIKIMRIAIFMRISLVPLASSRTITYGICGSMEDLRQPSKLR